MKKSFIFLIFILLISSSNLILSKNLKKNQVPKQIITNFEKEYPKAQKVIYTLELEGNQKIFEISFNEKNKIYEALYNEDGTAIQLEEELTQKDLPKEIISDINKKYPNSIITGVAKLIKNKNHIGFDVSIKSKNKEYELEYDKNGAFVKEH